MFGFHSANFVAPFGMIREVELMLAVHTTFQPTVLTITGDRDEA